MALEAPMSSTTTMAADRPVSVSSFAARTMSPDRRLSGPLDALTSRSPDLHQRLGVARAAGFHTPTPWPMPLLNPSDMVGPSPVNSNGTEFDDEASDAVEAENAALAAAIAGPAPQTTPRNPTPPPLPAKCMMLTTDLPDRLRIHPQESTSVVHAPQGFARWVRRLCPSRGTRECLLSC